MDRGAWWATVHGVTKSQTQLRTGTQPRAAHSMGAGHPPGEGWESEREHRRWESPSLTTQSQQWHPVPPAASSLLGASP